MKPLRVEENNSNDTFECDDDTNRVVLAVTFSERSGPWALPGLKKTILKIYLTIKCKKIKVLRNLQSLKNKRNQQAFQKWRKS